MWFFKRKKGLPATAVIHDDCFAKLPPVLQSRFYKAPDDAEPTHEVATDDDGDDFLLGAVVAGGLDLLLGSEETPTENYSIDTSSSVDTGADFGGGSGGGAGAEGSY